MLCKSMLLGMRLAMVCDAHHSQTHSLQRNLTQHDMLPQHPVDIMELFCECF
jgi:hypothetical protein